jgi:hypothetical protein
MNASESESPMTSLPNATNAALLATTIPIVPTMLVTFCLFNVRNAPKKWKVVVRRNAKASFTNLRTCKGKKEKKLAVNTILAFTKVDCDPI